MNTNPLRTLTLALIIFFSVVAVGFDTLYGYFSSNKILNGIVVSAMLLGLLYIYQASFSLQGIISLLKSVDDPSLKRRYKQVDDEEDFEEESQDDWGEENVDYKYIMGTRGRKFLWIMSESDVEVMQNWSKDNMFTHEQVDAILSAVRLRIGEVRNTSNYFSGILIILGLLGTFLGLLETIKSIGEVFSGDSIKFLVADKSETSGDEILLFFDAISKPLKGMAVAFSSSLFGLSGSLIVGLFAFISARNQSFFIFDLFDWLKDRTSDEDVSSLSRGAMTSMPASAGLMGSLMRGRLRPSAAQAQAQAAAAGGGGMPGVSGRGHAGPGGTGDGGSGGYFNATGEFTGGFKGDGEISGTLDANSLNAVLNRLESLNREAIEKNGLLAKAALKLGENLALEQKRLADIASYEQQTAVSLSAIRQQGDQQIHIMNQLVEAQYSNTDKEEFRALAAHFHRSFEILLSDIKTNNEQLSDKISKIGLAGMAALDNVQRYTTGEQKNPLNPPTTPINPMDNHNNNYTASVKGQQVTPQINPLSPNTPKNDPN